MTASLSAISAASPLAKLADWLELAALRDFDKNASRQELATELRLNGTIEAPGAFDAADNFDTGRAGQERSADVEAEVDHDGHHAEAIADDAFMELERRSEFADEGYPFRLEGDSVELKSGIDPVLSSYVFLLLLSWCGPNQDGTPRRHPERLFEALCAKAVALYLGGPDNAKGYRFGWPRADENRSFVDALGNIIGELSEGGQVRRRDQSRVPKDDQLDVIAWIPFPDKRPGQLIAFGQCATGANWEAKLSELPDTAAWCTYWMTDPPLVPPIRTFFVPHCIERDHWDWVTTRTGIIFERCRISSQLIALDGDEFESARLWTRDRLRN